LKDGYSCADSCFGEKNLTEMMTREIEELIEMMELVVDENPCGSPPPVTQGPTTAPTPPPPQEFLLYSDNTTGCPSGQSLQEPA